VAVELGALTLAAPDEHNAERRSPGPDLSRDWSAVKRRAAVEPAARVDQIPARAELEREQVAVPHALARHEVMVSIKHAHFACDGCEHDFPAPGGDDRAEKGALPSLV
jgi:hypothetical protein